ncbi:Mobile element protein [Candidatus Enterovibrio escicola]|uniref:Mobile element protein n=1 Tax=Candidatus Enterovibrio escicola TaxID=1927127 RepID=A0A2A5T3Z7_9GAMM|nr:Mobile element protein [Candidatus Enterovibrio escacola]
MFRYKQLLSPKLTLHNYNAQVVETMVNMKAMNKVIKLDMPVCLQTN